MADEEEIIGPVVADTWVTSREAVGAFDSFCRERKWVFAEIEGQKDFGKDGYVDFSVQGQLSGDCIAVQIKGGESFKRDNGFKFPATERQRRLWRNSSISVFGIAHDPADNSLYWLDLTSHLQSHELLDDLIVPLENQLQSTEDRFLESVWRARSGSTVAAALGSDDEELQEGALWDCWALGRHDPRYLVLVRRTMFGLRESVIDAAIYILNYCALNPDNFLDPSWMRQEDRRVVRRHFEWSTEEAVQLLDRTQDEDGFERGSFSSCIYWLLVGPDPSGSHFVQLVEDAVLRAAETGRDHAAGWGLVLRIYWAGQDGRVVLSEMCRRQPKLATLDVVHAIEGDLSEFGYVSIG